MLAYDKDILYAEGLKLIEEFKQRIINFSSGDDLPGGWLKVKLESLFKKAETINAYSVIDRLLLLVAELLPVEPFHDDLYLDFFPRLKEYNPQYWERVPPEIRSEFD